MSKSYRVLSIFSLLSPTKPFLYLLLIFGLPGCTHNQPKPLGYFRIDLPDTAYSTFANATYPYTFQHSSHATIREKSPGSHEKFWIDIYYPQFDATIYCSYKVVNDNFQEIAEDTREFVYKHTIKADEITEQPYIDETHQVYGILYELEGNTASPSQFVLTDSSHYVFRGALYFNAVPNKDSLAPVRTFIDHDIVRLIESFRHKPFVE